MNPPSTEPAAEHGWTLLAHPLFVEQFRALLLEVELLARRDPAGYRKKNATKRLAAVTKLAFEVIPQDPTRTEYRQGGTLGANHKHWFRAKFFQQYRLFFRYHLPSRLIVYAWLNDENSKRAYESANDAYRTFRRMLESGNPPDDWDELVSAAVRLTPAPGYIHEAGA